MRSPDVHVPGLPASLRWALSVVACLLASLASIAAAPFAAATPALHSITATIAVGSTPTAIELCNGKLYVANFGDNTVSVINPETNTVVGSPIAVGTNPFGLACDSNRIYTANYGSNDMTVIDATTDTVSTMSVPAGAGASDVVVTSGYAYVSNQSVGTISVINTATLATTTISVGGFPCGMTVMGGKVYVANLATDAGVAVIDAATRTPDTTIPLTGAARFIAATSDYLYVPMESAPASIVRISRSNPASSTTLSLDSGPTNISIAAGIAYVTSYGGDRTFVIDLSTFTVSDTVTATGVAASGVTTFGGNAYITLQVSNQVQAFLIGVTPPTAPDAPTGVSASAGSGQATVSFTPPAGDGGSPITSYEVTSNPDGITASGPGSPIVVPGLTNGRAYTFTVKAINGIESSSPSAASTAVTPMATQTITFANPGTQTIGSRLTLSAYTDSGLPVSFASTTPAVCTTTPVGGVLFRSTGICTTTADQAGDASHLPAATVTQSFIVNAISTGASGSTPGNAESPVAEPAGAGTPAAADVGSVGQPQASPVSQAAAEASSRFRGLPPAPKAFRVVKGGDGGRSTVHVVLSADSAGTAVRSTVVIVTDPSGKVVSRISVSVKAGDSVVDVQVPYVAEGYRVRVYNVNEVGVSEGGVVGASVRHASRLTTASSRSASRPVGTLVAGPVRFREGSAALDAADRRQLRLVARAAHARGTGLLITGYSARGSSAESTSLSTARARAVANYLSQQGVRVWMHYWGAGSLDSGGTARDPRAEIRTTGPEHS